MFTTEKTRSHPILTIAKNPSINSKTSLSFHLPVRNEGKRQPHQANGAPQDDPQRNQPTLGAPGRAQRSVRHVGRRWKPVDVSGVERFHDVCTTITNRESCERTQRERKGKTIAIMNGKLANLHSVCMYVVYAMHIGQYSITRRDDGRTPGRVIGSAVIVIASIIACCSRCS